MSVFIPSGLLVCFFLNGSDEELVHGAEIFAGLSDGRTISVIVKRLLSDA